MTSSSVPEEFGDLWSGDRERQNAAHAAMMRATGEPVPWAYEVGDDRGRRQVPAHVRDLVASMTASAGGPAATLATCPAMA
ncbi:hypothetical protein ACWGH8_31640 [Nonomuraea muscovyensis]|uniref:Uncharacterized protein n=1 Tax=Nonomuraea muscovyensis TaxID=1124761 RepID=A0A7X0CA48_9ACTN|nr:hypothetical protein [Nonomuraea muscovyensis]MBB6351234.1 hypothetical protein [Nonomuraea muscovyensis]